MSKYRRRGGVSGNPQEKPSAKCRASWKVPPHDKVELQGKRCKPPTAATQGWELRRIKPGCVLPSCWCGFISPRQEGTSSKDRRIGREKSRKGGKRGNQSPPWLFQGGPRDARDEPCIQGVPNPVRKTNPLVWKKGNT